MATIAAAGNGNWSNTGTWTGGVVPGNGDTANLNGKTIVMDIATVPAAGTLLGITGGGAGALTVALDTLGNCAINATTITAGTGNMIQVSGATANTLTITCTTMTGGDTPLYHNSTGTVVVNGNIVGVSWHAAINNTTGTLSLVGNVTGAAASGASGINNVTTGTVNVTGNATGGTSGPGVNNTAAGTVNLTGNSIGGTTVNGSAGVTNSVTGTVNLTGSIVDTATTIGFRGKPPTWSVKPGNYYQLASGVRLFIRRGDMGGGVAA